MKEHTHTTKLKAIKDLLIAYGLNRNDAAFVIEEMIEYGTLRAKNISSNLHVSGNEAIPNSKIKENGEVAVCSHEHWVWDGGRIEPIYRRCKDCMEVISEQTDR